MLRATLGVVILALIFMAAIDIHNMENYPALAQGTNLPATLPDKTPAYQPTEVQALRLKVAQQSAQLAQSQLREAQQAFQSALANLNAEAERVRLENRWPDDVVANLDTLQFSKKAAPPAKEDKKP